MGRFAKGSQAAEISRVLPTLSGEARAQYLRMQNPADLAAIGGESLVREQFAAGNRGLAPEDFRTDRTVFGASANIKGERPKGGQLKTTYSDVMQYSPESGSFKFGGGIPTKVEFSPTKKSAFENAATRFGGGLISGGLGLLTGGIPGALLGAYAGSGGAFPVTWNKWNFSQGGPPSSREILVGAGIGALGQEVAPFAKKAWNYGKGLFL
jgi:hypothetical protein